MATNTIEPTVLIEMPTETKEGRRDIWVDFNSVRNGLVHTLLPEQGDVKRGEKVRLVDGEGNSCDGEVHGILMVVRPDYETWKAEQEETADAR